MSNSNLPSETPGLKLDKRANKTVGSASEELAEESQDVVNEAPDRAVTKMDSMTTGPKG